MDIILYAFAFLCFAFAAVPYWQPRVNLIALGLAFWVLTFLIPSFSR